MTEQSQYLRDGAAIYRQSFAIIRAETDLSRFSQDEADIVVRMVHACGSTEASRYIEFGGGLVAAARAALAHGAPICASGEIPARAIAPDIARRMGALLQAGDVVHVSGCPKGCAHPGPSSISVYGRDGVCDVHLDGVLSRSVTVDALPGQIAGIVQSRAKLKVKHD